MSLGQHHPRRDKREIKGISTLLATLTTVSVLLVIGCVLTIMALDITPSGVPEMVMLKSANHGPGNYSVSVIAISSGAIERSQISIFINPDSSEIHIGNITGPGEYLSQGDSFSITNLQSGVTYNVILLSKSSGSFIASLKITAT